jgi:hypothetical protein
MISVENNKRLESVEIYLDPTGLDRLIRDLESLRGLSTHLHFMTPSWGGKELAESPRAENTTVNHLIIYSVPAIQP